MAIVGPWVAYGVHRGLARLGAPLEVQVFCAMASANVATYAVTSLQLALAYPDPTFAAALGKFATIFTLTQVPLAVVEGLLGVALFRVLRTVARPELEDLGVLATPATTAEAKETTHA